MLNLRTLAAVLLFPSLICGLAASAEPLYPLPYWCDLDGHAYNLVRTEYDVIAHPSNGWVTWEEAKVLAESSYHNGVQGRLVTINSAQEQSALTATGFLGGAYGLYGDIIWIGAYQDITSPDYQEPAGGWTWITDEPWGTYTYWDVAAPRNRWGGENYVMMSGGWFNTGIWYDVRNEVAPTNAMVSYIVEYVPEPGAIGLLGAGCLALIQHRPRRRKQTE